MKTSTRFLPLAIGLGAAVASAQAPIYIDLSPNSFPMDVTVVPGSGGAPSDVVVAGVDNTGTVFRWTLSSLTETSLLEQHYNGLVDVSSDGTVVSATTRGPDGIDRAARWVGGVWTQGPGLGGVSGTSETSAYAISGDGNVIGGLGWMLGGSGHAYRWTQPSTASNLGGPFSDPASRINALNGNGSVCAGWKDQLTGLRVGAYWIGGVLQPQPTFSGMLLGEAFGTNSSGTTIVGFRIYGATGSNAVAGWRWDSGVVSVLPNLAGEATQAVPWDVTDDGTIVVGHSGGNVISGTRDVIWFGSTPQNLRTYLLGLGTTGIGGYTDLGFVNGIAGNGGAICGRGTGLGTGQPPGGWVVIFPQWLPVGTKYCFGDGTGTPCPCGNSGAIGNGCANSLNASGGALNASGNPSIGSDSLGLFGSLMPNSSALYFQGTNRVNGGLGLVFGDGLRCAGGTVVRLGTKTNVSGSWTYPAPGDQPISIRGLIPGPGSLRTYQVWYRNAAAYCTSSTFNLTNAVELTWLP